MSDAVRAVYHIDALWTCTTHALREDSPPVEADGCTDVVGEFRFDAPVAPIDLVRLDQSCAWCFEMLRVRLQQVFLSLDRRRAVIVFRAPDLESVRQACRQAARVLNRDRDTAAAP